MLHAAGMTFGGSPTDLSFRNPESWTKVSSDGGSPPSLWISLGDPEAGPAVQLGICPPVPQRIWLDTHYHATDQMRAIIQGGFQLQRKHMRPGDFGYQVSGIPYREGLVEGGVDPLWMFAIHGDRRGARSTTTRYDGSFELGAIAEDQLDRPVHSVEDPYWDAVPGGAKGKSALAVSHGRTVGGFHWGHFNESQDWRVIAPGVRACSALLGDAVAGPVVLTIRADPATRILPEHRARTEIVIVPVAGTLHMGPSRICSGDVRIVSQDSAVGPLVAGAEGVDLIYLIADRRAITTMFADRGEDDTAAAEVLSLVHSLAARLQKQADA